MGPTQKDIARIANVSQAAVSLALNGRHAGLAQETVTRVRDVAERVGYRPNRAAQALRTRRTMILACAVPDLANPFYPALVQSIQRVAEEAGYDVAAIDTGGIARREAAVIDAARQGRFDGVVGVFFACRAADFAPLVEQGIPVVRIESSRKAGGPMAVDDLYVDNRAAALAVTRHLLGLGHRRVAMIAGEGGPQPMRVEGYRAAMAEAGLRPSVRLDPSFTVEGGRRAAMRLWARDVRPTALFAANDLMAIGAMRFLQEARCLIPGDVSVIGFDDIMAATLVSPALASVAQFQDRLGARAAAMLLARLGPGGGTPGIAEEMPFEIIPRASIGPPPIEAGPGRLREETDP